MERRSLTPREMPATSLPDPAHEFATIVGNMLDAKLEPVNGSLHELHRGQIQHQHALTTLATEVSALGSRVTKVEQAQRGPARVVWLAIALAVAVGGATAANTAMLCTMLLR